LLGNIFVETQYEIRRRHIKNQSAPDSQRQLKQLTQHGAAGNAEDRMEALKSHFETQARRD
jgi:hypothetical protein